MSQELPQPLNVSIEDHHAFIMECLRHVGTSEQHALIVADALVLTDGWGTFTHGSKLLSGYTSRVKHGGCRSDVDPGARESPNDVHQSRWTIYGGEKFAWKNCYYLLQLAYLLIQLMTKTDK